MIESRRPSASVGIPQSAPTFDGVSSDPNSNSEGVGRLAVTRARMRHGRRARRGLRTARADDWSHANPMRLRRARRLGSGQARADVTG
jgi:hypothetical protein